MIERLEDEARLSGAVIHGATVYLAGQIAEDLTFGNAGDIGLLENAIVPENFDGRHGAAGGEIKPDDGFRGVVIFAAAFLADALDAGG